MTQGGIARRRGGNMVIQERFVELEHQARGRLSRALTQGNERLRELDQALARVAREDWTVTGMRRHLEAWRTRAENLRSVAIKRAGEMPGEAVSALASGTRKPVQNLAKGLADMAKRLEPEKVEKAEPAPARKAEAKKPEAVKADVA
jgi:hypothetical protein